ncbi:MAG: nucleotidyltransferase domain-containing protein [Chloracidobacterium sp.]|nr:nucleotidyltransferase domain-containing protein [Chloracidobacterium sp.]
MNDLIKIAKQIFDDRYQDADVIFLAGSLLRGEGTPYSDLDLVVIFKQLTQARRESFYFQGYPVEAFVHDPETFNYFISELGRPSGRSAMAHMVAEGVEIPGSTEISRSLKRIASDLIAAGPPELNAEDERKWRYSITNLIDDIRQPRSKEELVASGAELYSALANYYFRANGLWSAVNKSIPRKLGRTDPELYARFSEGFEELFAGGRSDKVITLAETILKRHGGFLFDGYKLEASPSCRKPIHNR